MTSDILAILDSIASTPHCTIYRPCGLPHVGEGTTLPDDVRIFYETCGGCVLFEGTNYPTVISSPSAFVSANVALLGEAHRDDISDSWYVIAHMAPSEAISIDCNPARLGRCYDSFWDRHGVAGSCAIVALSFTELLTNLLRDGGARLYWTEESPGYGDAYDVHLLAGDR